VIAASHTIRVLLDDALLTLNRAVGVLRRRNVPVEDLVVGPSWAAGVTQLTFVLKSDDATADRVVQQFRKIVGVREVALAKAEDREQEES
jgi:acetolactate synthase small subunit